MQSVTLESEKYLKSSFVGAHCKFSYVMSFINFHIMFFCLQLQRLEMQTHGPNSSATRYSDHCLCTYFREYRIIL